MKGLCLRCHEPTHAVTRLTHVLSMSKRHPDPGYKLGYVREDTDPPRLICAQCLVSKVAHNAA